ncbi:futalosine hydrolase [Desulfovibrio sp. ZJ200]|uniref:futalosine hydrolase n=1 Tax=Desulfovibrio sp. ZJ200 TaxID=2709792 RepID=UPI0013ECEC71|nr:futalosine hydrolase [Desulfovibrio sp. ZJ200]
MALLICAAAREELAALMPHWERTATPDAAGPDLAAEMRLWPVRLKHRQALACLTGVGPLNAALALGLCLARAEAEGRPVDAVLNAGLAGSFNLADLPLRSLCLVREEIWPEYGLHDGHSVTAEAFAFPLWRRPATDGSGRADVRDRLSLSNAAGLAALGFRGPEAALPFRACRSLTVAGVSASFDRARNLWNRYHAELENMEGFAVAYACARQSIPCVEIRCVSNKVGPRAKDEKDFPGALAALGRILPALNLI